MENKLARVVPLLPVADAGEAQRFYRDVLGFKIDWNWEDTHCAVSRDDTALYLYVARPSFQPVTCMINVLEVDSLCAEWRRNGAKIVSEPEDKPWGLREFTVEDNNGHLFRIAQPGRVSRHQARERVDFSLVERLPTLDEYRKLTAAVGWENLDDYAAAEKSLPQSLFGVVAESAGKIAGMARVIGDGVKFFYIMDVVVTPEFQGRGVGTALMNAVVDFTRSAPQGGKILIGLFTGANLHGFYARFGFEGPETSLYGMSANRLVKAENENA